MSNLVPQKFTEVYQNDLKVCLAMSKNVTQKLIESHLVAGAMRPDEEIGFKITYDNLYVRSLTTTFDPQRRNQCIRIAENPGAAPRVLFRDCLAQDVTAYPTAPV
jgi:hypothetical protein